MFRAYDKKTGATVWEADIPQSQTGLPMTYMHRGKQYIVFSVHGEQATQHSRATRGVCAAVGRCRIRASFEENIR